MNQMVVQQKDNNIQESRKRASARCKSHCDERLHEANKPAIRSRIEKQKDPANTTWVQKYLPSPD
jgi:hypothetical protein